MSNNNNKLKNSLTQNWLRGNTNVYRIYNPNHTSSQLVNKNSLFKYVQSNRVPYLQKLNQLVSRVNATLGQLNRFSELVYHGGQRGMNLLYSNARNMPAFVNQATYYGETRPLNNYVFNKFIENQGRSKIRNPIYGGNLKLKNIKPNKLSISNQRQIRKRRRNDQKNEAAQRQNMLRRARLNAEERERSRRQQNVRAAAHQPNHLWYIPSNRGVYDSNGQFYGEINISEPNSQLQVGNNFYGAVELRHLSPNLLQQRQRLMNNFGWRGHVLFKKLSKTLPYIWVDKQNGLLFDKNGNRLPIRLRVNMRPNFFNANNDGIWTITYGGRTYQSVSNEDLQNSGNNGRRVARRQQIRNMHNLRSLPVLTVALNANGNGNNF